MFIFNGVLQPLSERINEMLINMNHTTNNKREDGVGSVLKFMNAYKDCLLKGKQNLLILKSKIN